MGKVSKKMPLTRRKGIANVLVKHLKQFLATFNKRGNLPLHTPC